MNTTPPKGTERSPLRALFVVCLLLLTLLASAQKDPALTRGSLPLSQYVTPNYVYGVAVPRTLPSAFPWPAGTSPKLSITVADTGINSPSVGSVGFGPDALFEFYNLGWQSWPKFYVASPGTASLTSGGAAGNDTTGTGSLAAPFASLGRAQQAVNGTTAGGIVMASTGLYISAVGFSSIGNVTTVPTKPTAFLAYNGPVEVGTFGANGSTGTTWTVDGTFPGIWTAARSNVNRVMDTTRIDKFGRYVELRYVPTTALCAAQADTWTNNGANVSLWVHRTDEAQPNQGTLNGTIAPTGRNTLILLQAENYTVLFDNTNTTQNLYFGTYSSGPYGGTVGSTDVGGIPSGWTMYGGAIGTPGGVIGVASTETTPLGRRCLILSNVILDGVGGKLTGVTLRNGLTSNCIYGLTACWSCTARGNAGDGFNLHAILNAVPAPYSSGCAMLTVNCSGLDNGRAGSQSNQLVTNHDGTSMIDVAGFGWENKGGTLGSSGWDSARVTSAAFFSTYVKDDLGDIILGYSRPPTACFAGPFTTFWLDSVKLDVAPGTQAIGATDSTSTVYYRNLWPTRGTISGAGTIAPFLSMTAPTSTERDTEAATNRYAFAS